MGPGARIVRMLTQNRALASSQESVTRDCCLWMLKADRDQMDSKELSFLVGAPDSAPEGTMPLSYSFPYTSTQTYSAPALTRNGHPTPYSVTDSRATYYPPAPTNGAYGEPYEYSSQVQDGSVRSARAYHYPFSSIYAQGSSPAYAENATHYPTASEGVSGGGMAPLSAYLPPVSEIIPHQFPESTFSRQRPDLPPFGTPSARLYPGRGRHNTVTTSAPHDQAFASYAGPATSSYSATTYTSSTGSVLSSPNAAQASTATYTRSPARSLYVYSPRSGCASSSAGYEASTNFEDRPLAQPQPRRTVTREMLREVD